MECNKKIKVVVAMSGGVDSAVAAALLQQGGFEVIGVFMKLWEGEERKDQVLPRMEGLGPSADGAERRARENAEILQIPFQTIDLRAEFKKSVVDRFIGDIKNGLTPNPCVVCNQEIKFGLFIERALAMGADFVATGHYSQIKKVKDGIYHLLKGKDKGKDQSYFLWRLGQKQLAKIIFPVGCFEKSEVRALARRWKLPSAETAESQEICFAGADVAGFLACHCGQKSGDIADVAGNVIGWHNGLWFYTIGQRKGIKLSGGPYFVAKKNFVKNELVVARSLAEIAVNKIRLGDMRWVAGVVPKLPLKTKVKIRYHGKDILAVLLHGADGFVLDFGKAKTIAASGQSAVFYKDQDILGGGIIEN